MDEAPVSALQASDWRSLCNLAQTHAITAIASAIIAIGFYLIGDR
jgi:hypothetical protein